MADAPTFYAHPTAVVDDGCQIGAGTKIWHFTHVMPQARIGAGCIIGQNVLISSGCIIGDRVKIQNNVSVYPGVTIEDQVFLGPSMVFTNVINPRAYIERKTEFLPTLVKRGASVGANATILCGVTLGEYSFVGAAAVVTRDVHAYATVYGNPARQHGWTCWCGVQLPVKPARAASEPELISCRACSRRYRRSEAGLMLPAS